MKKFFNILTLFLSSLLVFNSCEAEQPYYEGDSYVHFQNKSQEIFAISGTPYQDAKILYGITHAVSGNHQVKLVFDQSKSTAVEGVDFEILNNNISEITSGAVAGDFTIRVLTPQMTQNAKFAVFRVAPPTLKSAVFSDVITVNMSLTCPMSYFLGATGLFRNTTAVWNGPAQNNYIIEDISTGTNSSLAIKGFMDDGSDLILNYDPVTYKVSIPLQATGYVGAGGTQFAHASNPNAGAASSFNPCTRVLTLSVYWHARNAVNGVFLGGYFSNLPQTEVFTGL